MGRPKLLLPIGGRTVIARVVTAPAQGGADAGRRGRPPADGPGRRRLADRGRPGPGPVVVVADPATAEMRASVELGLDRLGRGPAPPPSCSRPGDSPGITPELVRRVVGPSG